MSTPERSSVRLIAVENLGGSQVAVVEETPHGDLAVGMSAGKPFAVSNRCRHLFASLGKGQVVECGYLQRPWHEARYDVVTGKMGRGPLSAFPVGPREVAIWLAGSPLRGRARGEPCHLPPRCCRSSTNELRVSV